MGLACVVPQSVVDFKFEHWCKRLLYVQLAIYNIWLFSFTIFTIIFQARHYSGRFCAPCPAIPHLGFDMPYAVKPGHVHACTAGVCCGTGPMLAVKER